MGHVRRLQTESKELGPIAAAERSEVDKMQLARDEMKKLKAATKAEKAENTTKARRARQDARIQSESSPAAPPTPAAHSAKRTGPVRRRQQTLQDSFRTPAVAASTTANDANTADASTADTSIADASIADTSATDACDTGVPKGGLRVEIRRKGHPGFHVVVETEANIADIKAAIEQQEGIAIQEQRLKFGAINLTNEDTVDSCGSGAYLTLCKQ
jgi:hypothetical protein